MSHSLSDCLDGVISNCRLMAGLVNWPGGNCCNANCGDPGPGDLNGPE